jgi:hypothetical protein
MREIVISNDYVLGPQLFLKRSGRDLLSHFTINCLYRRRLMEFHVNRMISEGVIALNFLPKFVDRDDYLFKLFLKNKNKNKNKKRVNKAIVHKFISTVSYRCCKRVFKSLATNVNRMKLSRKLGQI